MPKTDKINKGVIFKSCAPFTGCVTKMNKAQVDHKKIFLML